MTIEIDWTAVLREYEAERHEVERTYRERRTRLDAIIDDLQRKRDAASKEAPQSRDTSGGAREVYRGLKILEASKQYLQLTGRPSGATGVAEALLGGGIETRAEPRNFRNTVYNTLRAAALIAGSGVAQDERSKEFYLTDRLPSLV